MKISIKPLHDKICILELSPQVYALRINLDGFTLYRYGGNYLIVAKILFF